MTRGKYAQSAATRHALEERDSEIEMYRKNVARLTAENKRLKERLDQQARGHRQEVRRLKAERDEGLSPMVAVLRRELAVAREDADQAQRAAIALKVRWERVIIRLGQTVARWGLSTPERMEFLLELTARDELLDQVMQTVGVDDGNDRFGKTRDGIRAIQRARGERR